MLGNGRRAGTAAPMSLHLGLFPQQPEPKGLHLELCENDPVVEERPRIMPEELKQLSPKLEVLGLGLASPVGLEQLSGILAPLLLEQWGTPVWPKSVAPFESKLELLAQPRSAAPDEPKVELLAQPKLGQRSWPLLVPKRLTWPTGLLHTFDAILAFSEACFATSSYLQPPSMPFVSQMLRLVSLLESR